MSPPPRGSRDPSKPGYGLPDVRPSAPGSTSSAKFEGGSNKLAASALSRSSAVFIDFVVLCVCAIVAGAAWPGHAYIGVVAFVLLDLTLTGLRGTSLGRWLAHVRVVRDVDGMPPGFGRSVIRTGIVIVSGWLGWFAFLLVVRASDRSRLWWDVLAGTRLIPTKASWRHWASRNYRDPQAAGAAFEAIQLAAQHGLDATATALAGHRAAIAAGGEYRCRPDRITAWLALWAAIVLLFAPLYALGLAANGFTLGAFWLFLLFVVGPVVAIVCFALVSANSSFCLSSSVVARRTWLGQVAATFPLHEVASVNLMAGHQTTSWSDLGIGWAEFDVVHPERYPLRGVKTLYLPDTGLSDSLQSRLSAWLCWWSDERFEEFRRLFQDLKDAAAAEAGTAVAHMRVARTHRS